MAFQSAQHGFGDGLLFAQLMDIAVRILSRLSRLIGPQAGICQFLFGFELGGLGLFKGGLSFAQTLRKQKTLKGTDFFGDSAVFFGLPALSAQGGQLILHRLDHIVQAF